MFRGGLRGVLRIGMLWVLFFLFFVFFLAEGGKFSFPYKVNQKRPFSPLKGHAIDDRRRPDVRAGRRSSALPAVREWKSNS